MWARVARSVRLRFALDADVFAERLLELARRAEGDLGWPPERYLTRLSLDDLYLATACARGEEKAWEEVAERHFGFVREFARRYLREPAAGDVADQVIADLWQRGKIGCYEGRSTLRTWLATVVAHAALNAAKASSREVPLQSPELEGVEGRRAPAEDSAEAREARSRLSKLLSEAIEALPPAEKLLLLLYYEQALTLEEMAAALRASKATLSRRLKHLRRRLRDSVESRAQHTLGISSEALRAGIELGRLELDLADLVGRRQEAEKGSAVVVSRIER